MRSGSRRSSPASPKSPRISHRSCSIRLLLNARILALLAARDGGPIESCTAAARGISPTGLAALRDALDPAKAMILPAPALGADGYTIAVPVWRESGMLGWLLAQLTVPNPRDLRAFVVLLQAAAGFILYREQRRASATLAIVLERTSGLLDLFRRAGGELDFDHASRMAVDSIRDFLGCSRVFLAYQNRGRMRMRAISGTLRIDPKSPSHAPFEAAMREAVLAGKPIDFTPASPRMEETAAHEILQQQTSAARLLTLPLARGSGAVLLEWDAAVADSRLADASSPFLPVLFDLLAGTRRNPAAFAIRRAWSKATHHRRRALFAGLAALGLLLAIPLHYSVRGDARLAPTIKRVIAAPFQGQLKRSLVRPGDHVTEGQPLGEMENRELKLKESELLAARDRALKQRDRAMSATTGDGADFAAAQVANVEAQSVGEELALVWQKIAFLELKSPLTGVVVSGDLRRVEGQPVQQGQVLWEVAPLEKMIAEVEVPDREISRIRAGQPVSVRLESFASGHWKGALDKIHPQSEQRDGSNVFICEAPIDNSAHAAELRPGMRGRFANESARSGATDREHSEKTMRAAATWLNPLIVKVPLGRPDCMFTGLERLVRPAFGWGGFLIWIVVVLAGAGAVALDWPRFSHESTGFFARDNWLWLFLVWAVLKIIHELSHGVFCKHFGAVVREIGAILILFVPMGYVDATASLGLPSEWRRILVAAAGLYAEFFVAALGGHRLVAQRARPREHHRAQCRHHRHHPDPLLQRESPHALRRIFHSQRPPRNTKPRHPRPPVDAAHPRLAPPRRALPPAPRIAFA